MTTYTRPVPGAAEEGRAFHHPALFYTTQEDYLREVGGLIRTEAARGRPVLVAVPGDRLTSLRETLGAEAGDCTWTDMRQAGRNPGRVLSLLHEFADRHADRFPVIVGIAVRSPTPSAAALAHRTHPVITRPGDVRPSPGYTDPHAVCQDCDAPLPEPADPLVLHFQERDLSAVRDTAGKWAQDAGLSPRRHTDWLLAVNEATGNSVRHGGGHGTLRLWRTADAVVAEIRDRGRLTDPLVGRRRPDPLSPAGGRGVWMMHQLCDLVEVRTPSSGLIVRLQVTLA
ncbi:ATP-binding protein [Streptomyces sp. NPDC017405]|uniref:ATP-binding protein n=1 Tax=Streptomyces sp. NPDC017405 TaxID=3364993 RepID=UPI0037BD0C9F